MLLRKTLGVQLASSLPALKWFVRLAACASGTVALYSAAEQKRKQENEVRRSKSTPQLLR